MNMSRMATKEYIGESDLHRICEYYSDYRNFCVPCKMLVAKIKRKDGKGYTCKYDKSQTPYAKSLQFQKCYKVSKKHSSDANPGSTAVNPTIKH